MGHYKFRLSGKRILDPRGTASIKGNHIKAAGGQAFFVMALQPPKRCPTNPLLLCKAYGIKRLSKRGFSAISHFYENQDGPVPGNQINLADLAANVLRNHA